MRAAALPVYQMFPSLSGCRPCGPELGVGSGNSLNCSVFGSKRPTTFARWPVYQTEPSGATAGSCGYGGVLGVSHSSIFTSTESGTAATFTSGIAAIASTGSSNESFERIMTSRPSDDRALH